MTVSWPPRLTVLSLLQARDVLAPRQSDGDTQRMEYEAVMALLAEAKTRLGELQNERQVANQRLHLAMSLPLHLTNGQELRDALTAAKAAGIRERELVQKAEEKLKMHDLLEQSNSREVDEHDIASLSSSEEIREELISRGETVTVEEAEAGSTSAHKSTAASREVRADTQLQGRAMPHTSDNRAGSVAGSESTAGAFPAMEDVRLGAKPKASPKNRVIAPNQMLSPVEQGVSMPQAVLDGEVRANNHESYCSSHAPGPIHASYDVGCGRWEAVGGGIGGVRL